ncbi:YegP family protein [Arthrobacter celericrescens]|uniref:YegP family protein n=1 Tax=Arthrobacter celericrescens TaxID=2320851 RepID=UPI0013C4CC6F|nr:YegP family protein [Arthrobacter celericrescens]
MTGRYEQFTDDSGQHAFRLTSPDGKLLASSNGFSSAAEVLEGIEIMRSLVSTATIVDMTRT